MASLLNLHLECLLGMQCRDFTVVAADQTNLHSAIVMNDDEDKLYEISNKVVMGLNGSVGDKTQFSQLVAKNVELYNVKNGYALGTSAVTHFVRKNMIEALENGIPYILNVLMAGFDEESGAQLYYLDFLGTFMHVPFAAHGLGGSLSQAILSDYYSPDLTEAQAYEVLKLCVCEIHKRLFMNLPKFCVKTISKDGVKALPCINSVTVT